MEDLPATTPPDSPLPEGNADPGDPLRPEIEEEDAAATPPLADPHADMDATEDALNGQTDAIDAEATNEAAAGDISDDESILSEIDEAQFADFDPNAIAIEERPEVPLDETNVNRLQSHKRKRTDGEDTEKRRKKKEGRREKKPKRRKARSDEDDDFTGGDTIEGKRVRKRKEIVPDGEDGVGGGVVRKERPKQRERPIENEANLTPEERRKRALDRKIDDALKNPNRRRRRRLGGIDLEAAADELIESLRQRMGSACSMDAEARAETPPRPATHKLAMLPEVASVLNRNTLREQVVDPDTNLLQAVRFFLEPLQDGSLPAYDIQRVIFAALTKLPIGKDALIASGIGKVTLFYTKSKRPEPKIKRTAEKLLGEWTRPILKRTDDYRKRELQIADYNPMASAAAARRGAPATDEDVARRADKARRERMLATPTNSNRARHDGQVGSYSIVPKNNLVVGLEDGGRHRGRAADEVFRRIKSGAAGGARR